ncbi:MAG: alpha/beta hydrolase [Bacteroidota bacterium]
MSESKLPNYPETPIPHIYTISGMGMNEQLFRRLKLPYPVIHLPWMEPLKGETLRAYSERLGKDVPTDKPVILIGLSFGGVVALEMAEWLNPEKVVLISTIKVRKERPLFFRIMEYIPLYLFQNKKIQDATIGLWGPFFGINTKADIRRVKGFFCDLSPNYYRWAIRQMVNLRRSKWKAKVLHIHGTRDKVFPAKYIEEAQFIEEAGHAMIIREHTHITQLIQQFLN